MASQVVAAFGFEIGDLVYFIDAAHNDHARPRRFQIAERVVVHNHGGTQCFYRLTRFGADLFPAIAFCRDEPPYIPDSPETLLAQSKEVEMRKAMYRSPDNSADVT